MFSLFQAWIMELCEKVAQDKNYELELLIMYVHEWVIWSLWNSIFSLVCGTWRPSWSSFQPWLTVILRLKPLREVKPYQGNVRSLVTPLNTNTSWLMSSQCNKPLWWEIPVVIEKSRQNTSWTEHKKVQWLVVRENENCSRSDCDSLSVGRILRKCWKEKTTSFVDKMKLSIVMPHWCYNKGLL